MEKLQNVHHVLELAKKLRPRRAEQRHKKFTSWKGRAEKQQAILHTLLRIGVKTPENLSLQKRV